MAGTASDVLMTKIKVNDKWKAKHWVDCNYDEYFCCRVMQSNGVTLDNGITVTAKKSGNSDAYGLDGDNRFLRWRFDNDRLQSRFLRWRFDNDRLQSRFLRWSFHNDRLQSGLLQGLLCGLHIGLFDWTNIGRRQC
jgi:hypothetical protein